MRLAFIIRDLGAGGAQRQLVTLACGLQRAGHEVSVLHFYGGMFETALRAAGVRTTCMGKKSRWDLVGLFVRLVKAAREARPEVLHGYLAEANLMALFLKPFCRFPKVVWGVRDSQTDAHLWGLLGRLSFWLNCVLARFADVIICNSKAGRDYYAARGYPQARMHVVPNGIDTERFQPPAQARKADGVRVFGLVGRLSPMKDHATFLRAAAEVPDARFVIVGSGDENYAWEMRKLATQLRLAERVTWLPAQEDMPAVYAGFDCLVNSSAFGEGFSNVIGEAMACGVPCIASDVGDSAWLVGAPKHVFPAGDHAALARRMRDFQPHDPRPRMVREFSVEKLIQRTEKLLAKKVLWFTTGLGSGGAEMMLTQMVKGLPRLQHVVVSLTGGGKHADALREAGIEVHSLDMPAGKPTPAALWRLWKRVRQTRAEVLMGWMYHGCLAAVLARCMRFKRVALIWNVRQSLYDLKLEKRGSALVIRALSWFSWLPRCITYNSQLSARQHEAAGYRAGKTRLVPNGFDVERWRPLERAEKLALRRSLQPDKAPHELENSFHIGRFGRNSAMKDHETFLQAAKLIVARYPRVQFVIVGAGTEMLDIPPELKAHVQVLGERHDLPELTAALDIAVSSSSFGEGFPNVVGEAMACAVPVVATDIGDTRWVMGDTGHIVPPRDPLAIANGCIGILEAGITRNEAARRRIEECFSLKSVLGQFEELITLTDGPYRTDRPDEAALQSLPASGAYSTATATPISSS